MHMAIECQTRSITLSRSALRDRNRPLRLQQAQTVVAHQMGRKVRQFLHLWRHQLLVLLGQRQTSCPVSTAITTTVRIVTITTCSSLQATRPVWMIKATTPTTLVATTLFIKVTSIADSQPHKAMMAVRAKPAPTKVFTSTGHSTAQPPITVHEQVKPSSCNTALSKRLGSSLDS